jgi:hypothetical protein
MRDLNGKVECRDGWILVSGGRIRVWKEGEASTLCLDGWVIMKTTVEYWMGNYFLGFNSCCIEY